MSGATRGLAAILAVPGLMSAACGPVGSPGSDPARAVDAALAGRSFVVTTLISDGSPRPPVGESRITISFTGDTVGAYADCNQLGSSAATVDGRLVVDSVGGTEIGCAPALHRQDEWVARFLTAEPAYEVDGDRLVLRTSHMTVELVARAPIDDGPT